MMKNPYYNWRQSKAVAVVVAAFSLLQEQSNEVAIPYLETC